MRCNSIRARLTAVFVLAVTGLMFLVSACALWFSRHTAEQSADRLLSASIAKMKVDLRGSDRAADLSELTEDAGSLYADNLALLVIGPDGHVILRSQAQVPAWPRRKDGWRVRTARVGAATLVLGLPWMETERTLAYESRMLLTLNLVVILASGAGAWLLVGHTLSPIGSLAREAHEASTDRWPVFLTASSQDAEVVDLVTTLNGLLRRLAEAAASRDRFYAAASHELRSPLQALSGHLEVALSRERTASEYHTAVDEAYQQTRRLISLTRDLLTLNQLESAQKQECAAVNPADVCERTIGLYRSLIEQRGLVVSLNLDSDEEIDAPPSHLAMLIRNLIENAARHAVPGGKVVVAVTPCADSLAIEICNTWAPLSLEVSERLTEPFYRPDASRNHETGGNGLGLAICRAIASANGWKVTVIPGTEMFRVEVAFPTERIGDG